MTRLADQIIACAARPQTAALYGAFAAALKSAVPFEIHDDFGFVVGQIEKAGLKKILPASGFCNVPFRRVWFEWKESSRRFLQSTSGQIRPPSDMSPVPDRMGVLLETDETHARGVASFAWVHFGDQVNLSLFSCFFDWTKAPEPVPDGMLFNITQAELAERCHEVAKDWVMGCTDEEIYRDRLRHGIHVSPHVEEYCRILGNLHEIDPGKYADLVYSARQDIEGEPRFVRALLICLNSRNLAETIQDRDIAKLNKLRKKAGKTELLSFSKVKLKLSGSAKRSTGGGADREALRLHVVRGHYKVRSGGVFFWSPFMRGNKASGMVQRSGYEVLV